jgi:hypothetical protein
MVVLHCRINFRIVLRKMFFLSKIYTGYIHWTQLRDNVCQSSLCIKEKIMIPKEHNGSTFIRCPLSRSTTTERKSISYYRIHGVQYFGSNLVSFDHIRLNKWKALLYLNYVEPWTVMRIIQWWLLILFTLNFWINPFVYKVGAWQDIKKLFWWFSGNLRTALRLGGHWKG